MDLISDETAYKLLTLASAGLAECNPIPKTNKSCFEYAKQTSTVEAVVDCKNRTVAQLAYAVEPRNWASCIGGPFTKTVEIEVDANGVPLKKDGQFVEKISLKLGESWKGTLYEVFKLDFIIFHNVIEIDFSVDTTSGDSANHKIELDYTQIGNVSVFLGTEFVGLLQMNKGNTTVTAQAGGALVEGYKNVKFNTLGNLDQDAQLNYIAPALLTLWQANSKHFGLCCTPP